MTEWQDISSAPKDGTWILLSGGTIDYGWGGDTISPAVVAQCTEELNGRIAPAHWQFAWYDGGYYGEYKNPTHWQPLPPLPETT